jgi:hypothetical protein
LDVVAWLNRLGLEQYEQAFRENDVDAEVLPELTAEDLIGLGVTSIGHRRFRTIRRIFIHMGWCPKMAKNMSTTLAHIQLKGAR